MILKLYERKRAVIDDHLLCWMIFINSRCYSFLKLLNDIYLEHLIFDIWRRCSVINHWRLYSTTGDNNQPLKMMIGRHRWCIVCSNRWIHHLRQMNVSKNISSATDEFQMNIKNNIDNMLSAFKKKIIWFPINCLERFFLVYWMIIMHIGRLRCFFDRKF
jgi:hypothetical protein